MPPLLAGLLLATGLGLGGAGFAGDWLSQALPPLLAGLAATSIVTGERAVELHLSLPTPLRTTLRRRLALLAASALAAALTLGAGLLPSAGSLVRFTQLCGLTALLAAVGAWSAVALRSAGGASVVVLAAWFGDLFVVDRLNPGPAVDVSAQILVAAAFAARAARLLVDGRDLTEGSRE